MKKFSKFEVATIKRTAQSVNPMVSKRAKLMEQIVALQEEYDALTLMQEQYEASIKTMTGGYGTEDLVEKVIETTGSVDKTGKPVKVTKYVLKYPETIIPVIDSVTSEEIDESAEVTSTEYSAEEESPINKIVEDHETSTWGEVQ